MTAPYKLTINIMCMVITIKTYFVLRYPNRMEQCKNNQPYRMEQESGGRVAIQLLNVDHNNIIMISNSCSCFFLITFHLLPCCKSVHNILSFIRIFSLLNIIFVLSIPPLSCPASCLSPDTLSVPVRGQDYITSILTNSYPSLSHEHQQSNNTAQDMEHEWKGKVVPVN
jgi:hypothetical protein